MFKTSTWFFAYWPDMAKHGAEVLAEIGLEVMGNRDLRVNQPRDKKKQAAC